MGSIRLVRPSSESERHTRTTVDTIEVTEKYIDRLALPPFQRQLRANAAKMSEVIDQIREDGGVLPGIITLGVLDGVVYIVDGQHRLFAFKQTGLDVGYADVRTVFFVTMAAMAAEYKRLNSSIVRMRADDTLRALEHSCEALAKIRRRCPFIGYDHVRRDPVNAPVVSMSAFIRAWEGSRSDAPVIAGNATEASMALTPAETDHAVAFANLVFAAWGRDREYARLWGGLNLSLCGWIYRRMVLGEGLSQYARSTRLDPDDFKRCMMALSADREYVDWLVGRSVLDRDRSPAYARVKAISARRLKADGVLRPIFPQPAWAVTH